MCARGTRSCLGAPCALLAPQAKPEWEYIAVKQLFCGRDDNDLLRSAARLMIADELVNVGFTPEALVGRNAGLTFELKEVDRWGGRQATATIPLTEPARSGVGVRAWKSHKIRLSALFEGPITDAVNLSDTLAYRSLVYAADDGPCILT